MNGLAGLAPWAAVGVGAAFGAWCRWRLGLWLNPVFPTLPMGTLVANLAGGYIIGLAIAFFQHHPGLPAELRLVAITGFLGALTTFSTFSAEVVSLLDRGQLAWGLAAVAAHVLGSLAMTAMGLWTVGVLRQL